jgi:PAS domain S-box-containing protein
MHVSESLLVDKLVEFGVAVLGPQAEILEYNQTLLELLGLTAEELLRTVPRDPAWAAFYEDGTPLPPEEWPPRRALVTHRPERNLSIAVDRPRTKDRAWLLVSAFPRFGPDGALTQVVCTVLDNTRWYEQDRLLREAELLRQRKTTELAALVDSSFDAIIGRNASGIVDAWNPAAERLFGWPAAEMIGSDVGRIVPPEIEQDGEFVRTAIARGESLGSYETVRMHRDGTRIDVLMTVSPVPGAQRSVVIFHDNRARKLAEQVLERSAAEFRALIERAPDGMFVHDHGRFVLVNDAFARMMGYGYAGELVGSMLPDLLHPEDARDLLERVRAAERGEAVGSRWHARAVRRDGTAIDVEVSSQTITFEGRRLRFVIARDVTQSRSEQAGRLKAERVFRSAFDYSGIGMALVAPDGRWLAVNDALCGIVGYSRSELLALTFQDVTHPDDLEKDLALVREMLEGSRTNYALEKRYLRKDGSEVWILLTVSLVRDAEGKPEHFISQIQDIDARKRQQVQIEAALREKEVLLKEVHHRVKNNLQVISSLLALQSRRLPEGAARSAIAESRQRIEAIARFHERLYRSGDLASVDVIDYLRDLAGESVRGRGGARIEVEVGGDALTLPVDVAIPCGLIVNEWLTNSIKHAFEGRGAGRIEVRLRAGQRGRPSLSYADDGVGLPADVALRQKDSLGLRLVELLAEQMGASIRVHDGPGTRFTLDFH